jgi:hypothetical protein
MISVAERIPLVFKKNHFSFFSTIKQAELAFVDSVVPFSQMLLLHPKSEE